MASLLGTVGEFVGTMAASAASNFLMNTSKSQIIDTPRTKEEAVSKAKILGEHLYIDRVASVVALAEFGALNDKDMRIGKRQGTYKAISMAESVQHVMPYINEDFLPMAVQKGLQAKDRNNMGDGREDLKFIYEEAIPHLQQLHALHSDDVKQNVVMKKFWGYVQKGTKILQQIYGVKINDYQASKEEKAYLDSLEKWNEQIYSYLHAQNSKPSEASKETLPVVAQFQVPVIVEGHEPNASNAASGPAVSVIVEGHEPNGASAASVSAPSGKKGKNKIKASQASSESAESIKGQDKVKEQEQSAVQSGQQSAGGSAAAAGPAPASNPYSRIELLVKKFQAEMQALEKPSTDEQEAVFALIKSLDNVTQKKFVKVDSLIDKERDNWSLERFNKVVSFLDQIKEGETKELKQSFRVQLSHECQKAIIQYESDLVEELDKVVKG